MKLRPVDENEDVLPVLHISDMSEKAKAVADNAGNVKENVPAAEAEDIKAQLEAAGATVELV